MAVKHIEEKNFEQEVLNFKGTVFLDFWASWCGPCQRMSSVVEEIAKENPDILVGKVNVDENPNLAMAFRVMSIPMFVVLKDGKVVSQTVGARSKQNLEAML